MKTLMTTSAAALLIAAGGAYAQNQSGGSDASTEMRNSESTQQVMENARQATEAGNQAGDAAQTKIDALKTSDSELSNAKPGKLDELHGFGSDTASNSGDTSSAGMKSRQADSSGQSGMQGMDSDSASAKMADGADEMSARDAVRHAMTQSGFKNVQFVDAAYLVAAEAPNGRRVMMFVDLPDHLMGSGSGQDRMSNRGETASENMKPSSATK
jgi:hypothetical protein